MDNRVIVMLTTYNGEKYLPALIESVLGQTHKNISLYIRDDGSTDSTLQILETHKNNPSFIITAGENIGTMQSFFELLASAGDAPYYSFCDQDDVWLPDKISRAVEKLSDHNETPAAYFCRLDIVSEDLRHIAYTPLYKKLLGLKTSICGNVLTGMACVINKKARELIISRLPDFAVMYDWWVYIVVSAFGKIIYDDAPLVLYRQHGANVYGRKTGFGLLKKRVKKYAGGGYHKRISRQANEFLRLFGEDLKIEDLEFIKKFVAEKNFFDRLRYALTCPAYRQDFIDNIFLRAMILINHI